MSRYTFGAIDIGSNAIRLLIDYVEEYKKPEFKKPLLYGFLSGWEKMSFPKDILPKKRRRI